MNRKYQLPAGTRIPAGTRVPVFLARTFPVKRVGPVRAYPPGTRVIEIRVLPLVSPLICLPILLSFLFRDISLSFLLACPFWLVLGVLFFRFPLF